MWAGYFAFMLVMIATGLLHVVGKTVNRVTFGEAASWSVVWVIIALLFNGRLWRYPDGTAGREQANEKLLEFLTGYAIEKSLAVDNIVV